MSSDIEFDFDGAGGSHAGEEHLDDGRSGAALGRVPTGGWLAVAVLVAAVVAVTHRGGHAAARPSLMPSASASTVPPVVAAVTLQQHLTAAALDTAPLTNVIRPAGGTASCGGLAANSTARQSQFQAIGETFPAFARYESGSAMDASSGLCAVTLRAHGADGSILFLRISSPPNPNSLIISIDDAQVTGAYPTFVGGETVTSGGFLVEAAVIGTGGPRPSFEQVMSLAQDPGLTW